MDILLRNAIEEQDPEVFAAISGEERRQKNNLELIASENYASRAVREPAGELPRGLMSVYDTDPWQRHRRPATAHHTRSEPERVPALPPLLEPGERELFPPPQALLRLDEVA